jgi:hypothetical protein
VGREVCRLHGGATPRGIASTHWRTGAYSRDVPSRLLARFRRGLADPELIGCTRELALCDARIGEVLAALPPTPAESDRESWGELLALIEQRRRLAESERRRREALGNYITTSQALALAGALTQAVTELVPDAGVRGRIAARIEALLSREPTAALEDTADAD